MHLHLQTQARVWCGGEVGPGHVLLCPGRGQQQPHVRAARPGQPEHARVPGEPGAAGGGRGGGGGGAGRAAAAALLVRRAASRGCSIPDPSPGPGHEAECGDLAILPAQPPYSDYTLTLVTRRPLEDRDLHM